MTPSPLPGPTIEAWSSSNTLSTIAIVVAGLALIGTLANSFVALKNRADKRSVSLTFVAKQELPQLFGDVVTPGEFQWSLHNSGETAIANPTVSVENFDGGPVIYFQGTGTVAAGGQLRLLPMGSQPHPYESAWFDASISVKASVLGKERVFPAVFRHDYL